MKRVIIKKAKELEELLENCYDEEFVLEILNLLQDNSYIDEEELLNKYSEED